MNTHTLPLPPAVIWDLDGTLIDQTRPIVRCFREVVTGLDHPEPGEAMILRSLGGPLASTLELLLAPGEVDEGVRRFRARFPEIMLDGLELMPGATQIVAALAGAGVPQAALTNKHGPTARTVCDHTGLSACFTSCTGSTDTEWNKPDPRLTAVVIESLGAGRAGCVVVGDSPTDVETAHQAGLACYGIATGAHSTIELRDAGAAAAFDSLPALAAAWELR